MPRRCRALSVSDGCAPATELVRGALPLGLPDRLTRSRWGAHSVRLARSLRSLDKLHHFHSAIPHSVAAGCPCTAVSCTALSPCSSLVHCTEWTPARCAQVVPASSLRGAADAAALAAPVARRARRRGVDARIGRRRVQDNRGPSAVSCGAEWRGNPKLVLGSRQSRLLRPRNSIYGVVIAEAST